MRFTTGAIALPSTIAAAAGGSEHISLPLVLGVLAAMLVVGKLLGELATRLGQPAVLGELLAGVLLGAGVLGVVPSEGAGADMVYVMAEIGVVLLLFEIGLETDLREMFRVGTAALAVAIVGVALPFGLGLLYWLKGPHPAVASSADLLTAAIFIGATLTATSVGITGRVLSDLGQMHTTEARIVLGAAVIDDIIGLVILSVVAGLASGVAASIMGIARVALTAVGVLAVAIAVGSRVMPGLFDVVQRMRVKHVLVVYAIAFAFGLAALAASAGSALIIGAFAAGLILSGTNQFDAIEEQVHTVASIFTPIFFVSMGAALNIRLLDPSHHGSGAVLAMAGTLTLLGILGKLAAGWAAPWQPFHRLSVGVGMIPRGEVGLIFAAMGRRSGVLGEEVFSAVLLMVMATTLVTPPALKALFARSARPAG